MKDTDKKLLQLLNKRELSIDDKRWLLDYIENTDQKELLQILNLEFNSHIHDPKEVDVDFPDQILAEIYSKAGIQAPDKPKIKHLWAKRLAVASTFAGLFLAVYFGFLTVKKHFPKV